jgi:hypothetical protein
MLNKISQSCLGSLFIYTFISLLNFGVEVKAETIDIEPKIIQESPTLEKWLQKIPNVLDEINNEPSFNAHLRLGYLYSPSNSDKLGIGVGIDDLFVGKSSLTLTGDYQTSFSGIDYSTGLNAQFYLLPLGYVVNVAPVVGYRSLGINQYNTQGLNLGGRVKLILSRNNSADISFTQTFVNLGNSDEVGISILSTGYAITSNFRISAEIQQENSKVHKDSHVGIFLEWILK